MRKISFLLVFGILINSCKEVVYESEVIKPLTDTTYINNSNINAQTKVVLLEEFTGVRCSNCPDGHKEAARLENIFGNKIAIVGIHSPFLASPYASDEPNFITIIAKDIADFLTNTTKPAAAIDRVPENNNFNYQVSAWENKINQRLNEKIPLNISQEVRFDNQKNKYILKFQIEFLEDFTSQVSYSIFYTESKLKATQLQKDGVTKIKDYIHDKVLRNAITRSTGNSLSFPIQGKYEKGRTYIKEFELELKTQDGQILDVNNSYIVSFLSKDSNKEVLQANKVKIKN